MVKVFITDDQELYLEGLALLLKKQPGLEVTGTATSAGFLLEQLPTAQMDVLLLDVHLPDKSEEDLLSTIRGQRPDLKIVYLTMMRGTRYIHKLIKYNIQGYVLKSATTEELVQALHTVHEGGTYFSKGINVVDMNTDFRSTIMVDEGKIDEILSKREIEVLKLICKEYSNSAIAARLFISTSTVETHRKNLIAKLGVSNTIGLVKFALRNKLIE